MTRHTKALRAIDSSLEMDLGPRMRGILEHCRERLLADDRQVELDIRTRLDAQDVERKGRALLAEANALLEYARRRRSHEVEASP